MKKTITSTQYLKKGDLTNVGEITMLHPYKGITTTDGFYFDLNVTEVYKLEKATDLDKRIRNISSKLK